MRPFLLALAAAVMLPQVLAAQPARPAAAPALSPAQTGLCVTRNRIRGWNAPDSRSIIIRDTNRKYRVSLAGPCFDLDNPFNGIRFDITGCMGPGDSILVLSDRPGLGRQRCMIRAVEPYSGPMEADSRSRSSRR